MKSIALAGLFLSLTACVHKPVTKDQWQTCEETCKDKGGVMEACNESFRGRGCHCNDDTIVWLDDN